MRLSPDIQSVVEMTKAHPAVDGLFHALLVVLENASDSSIISAALSQIDPDQCQNPQNRQRAATLLARSDSPHLARHWRIEEEALLPGNVVPLRGGRLNLPDPGDAVTFADIGGLEQVKDQVRRQINKPLHPPGPFQAFSRTSTRAVP